MRMFLGLVVLSAMGLMPAAADDKPGEKIDGKKLVGKWTPKDEKGPKFTIEFTKDGKVNMNIFDMKVDGTYKLEGNKITLTLKTEGKEETMTRTISKLTDEEIVSKDDKGGKEDTLVRVKPEKK